MVVLSVLLALVGLLSGGLVNALADDLPARVSPRRPHCPRCEHKYKPADWLAVIRRFRRDGCPSCGLPTRLRAVAVEIGAATLLSLLPWFITTGVELVTYSFYVLALLLVIVIDLEHRLILHVVTFPVTVFALTASLVLSDLRPLSAVLGALFGFVFFYLAYLLGGRLFGPGALGFGDVTLAMTMGAMLGLPRTIFALVMAILLGGIWSLAAMATGRISRRTYFAYGPFLAAAGIIMIIWGNQLLAWYIGE